MSTELFPVPAYGMSPCSAPTSLSQINLPWPESYRPFPLFRLCYPRPIHTATLPPYRTRVFHYSPSFSGSALQPEHHPETYSSHTFSIIDISSCSCTSSQTSVF